MSTPEYQSSAKSHRVLACILCQQRKVKCDRKFPCANCVKSNAQCVPATQVKRQRRKKFSERELLERVRRYEGLLRQNNISFDPLLDEKGRGSNTPDDALFEGQGMGQEGSSHVKIKSEPTFETKDIWEAMKPSDDEDDDDDNNADSDNLFLPDLMRRKAVKKAMDELFSSNDHLLFGSRQTAIDLSTLHPDQAQIFRLWQVYLESVDPILKVTHTPTLQARIINAASDVTRIEPELEALMFGIYCIASLGLREQESSRPYGPSDQELWRGYQFGCQQALLNCGVLRSGNHDCLTALYLYIISIRGDTDPRSLACLFSIAIHIAQRMGLHNEPTNSKYTPLEAEMRRRLWWSLVNSGHRVAEMADYKTTTLLPTWDCKVPLNVNDFDIGPEMKISPANSERPTEAIFAVVRGEMGEAMRHWTFHLDFTNPSLKAIAKDTPQSNPDILARTIETNHLNYCNPENPLHLMTLLTIRGLLEKNRLLEYYSKPLEQQTNAQRDSAFSAALTMLECDSELLSSPLTRRYRWYTNWHFPFTAYVYIVQDMKRRPRQEQAERAWRVLNGSYEARFRYVYQDENPLFLMLARLFLHGWDARQAALQQSNEPLEVPEMIKDIRRIMQNASKAQSSSASGDASSFMEMTMDDFPIPVSMDFETNSFAYGMLWQGSAVPGPGGYPNINVPATTDADASQLPDWTTLDWSSMHLGGS